MSQVTPGDLAHLLPQRAIAVRPPQTIDGGTIGVIILLLIFLGGIVAWLGPGIASDWRMRDDAVAAADLQIREARCRSWLATLRFCSVTVDADRGDTAGERTLWYAFLDGTGDQAMAPLRSRSDPSRVATDLGLAKVYNRLITLLLFAGLLVFCIGVAATMLWRGAETRRAFAAMSGRGLRPVVVEMERNNRLPPRRRLWVYLYQDGGKRERALAEWPSKLQPLFTTPDEGWALALQGEEGGTPMLLDVDLGTLDLTDAEKAAFRAAFLAQFGERANETATH
jgi:hypothetical protein